MNRKVVGILGGSKPFLPPLEIPTNVPDETENSQTCLLLIKS